MDTINIKIPSIPENIRVVESFIDNAKEKYNISEDVYGNIMVATTEAVNNAILHGNQSDESKHVELTLILEDDKVKFIIEDEGPGFDYENLPDPTAPENLEKIGGRGIFLIKNLTDEIEFDETGNKIEMTFNM